MNKGLLAGIRSSQWLNYIPALRAFNYSGGTPVDPAIGNGSVIGRYYKSDSGLVVAGGLITFGSTSTYGSGEDFWGVSMPFPINRSSSGADLTAGVGMAWQGSAASPQLMVPLTPTIMDPAFLGGNQTQEDNFIQFFCPWCLSQGTATITSGNTSVTVNHLMPFTPRAEDIHLVNQTNPTNNTGQLFINGITSTQFVINCRANPGASGLSIGWKVRGEPIGPTASLGSGGLLASSLAPYTWAPGHMLGFQAIYEARR